MSVSSKVLFSTFLLFCPVVLASVTSDPTKVSTRQGYVKGMQQDIQINDDQTKTVYKFLGVPYAEKPIGNLRFKRPQALTTRRPQDYNATYYRPICYQDPHYFDSIRGAWPGFNPKKNMSEDCLYLNIYTPSTRGTRKYPVIVHIHGGSYFGGTPIRDVSPGEYLPTRDVVLVTIQYRLAVFGFFSTGDSEAPGNLGLLDQVEALKWIQQNIEFFSGNKSSVTLLGESAGGSSVSLHYLSPLSRGLFHRGIAVSGVDLSPFALKPRSTVLGASIEMVKMVNCQKPNSREIVECLRSKNSTTISKNPKYWLMQPFVDQHFLLDEPQNLRRGGNFQKLPFMSGFVSQEGSHVLQLRMREDYTESSVKRYLENFLVNDLNRTKNQAPFAFFALEIMSTPDVNTSSEYRKKLVKMMSDYYVAAPTLAALTFHSVQDAPTYMFEFAHRSQYHPKPAWMGVVHEDTTAYKFGLPFLDSANTQLRFDDDDKKVSDIVVTTFTNFAKFGNPTPSPVHGVRWPEFNSSTKAYVEIKKNPVTKREYHPLRMYFWNSFLPSLLQGTSPIPSVLSDAVGTRGNPNWDVIW